jgi:hypothetical protein
MLEFQCRFCFENRLNDESFNTRALLLSEAQPKNALINPLPPNLETNAKVYECLLLTERKARTHSYNFTILQFYNFTILQFYNFTILQFYNFTILQFYNFTILQF